MKECLQITGIVLVVLILVPIAIVVKVIEIVAQGVLPGFEALKEDVEAGDKIVVVSMGRLSRSLNELLTTVNHFTAKGVLGGQIYFFLT